MNNTQNKSKRIEALTLSREILKNFEFSEIPLSQLCLKTKRLARLCGDNLFEELFNLEINGYKIPIQDEIEDANTTKLIKMLHMAGRVIMAKNSQFANDKMPKQFKGWFFTGAISDDVLHNKLDTFSIAKTEELLESHKQTLRVMQDPNINISTTHINQELQRELSSVIKGNSAERERYNNTIGYLAERLLERKAFIYNYITRKNIELEFANNLYDVFHSNSELIKIRIVRIVPDGVKKLTSIIDNLKSSNKEDWSNAVHSCRKLLESVADIIFPPREDIIKNGKTIKLGKNNYINRLITFVDENKSSPTYSEVVGSQLKFLGDRLDTISNATQKGSHQTLKEKSEAEKYFIYTSLILSDILSLYDQPVSAMQEELKSYQESNRNATQKPKK